MVYSYMVLCLYSDDRAGVARVTNEQREYGAKVFGALSNASRLKIVELLADGAMSVKDICLKTTLKQPVVSGHLAALLAAGIVACEPTKNLRVYSIRDPRVSRMLGLVEDLHEVQMERMRRLLANHLPKGGLRTVSP